MLGLGFAEVLDLEIEEDEARIEVGGMAAAVVGTRRLRMIWRAEAIWKNGVTVRAKIGDLPEEEEGGGRRRLARWW